MAISYPMAPAEFGKSGKNEWGNKETINQTYDGNKNVLGKMFTPSLA